MDSNYVFEWWHIPVGLIAYIIGVWIYKKVYKIDKRR